MTAAPIPRPAPRWGSVVRLLGVVSLATLPLLFIGGFAAAALHHGSLAVDTEGNYLPAAHALLHGETPYRLGDIARGTVFASPPFAALIFAPLLLLPGVAADVIASFAMLACVLGALRLLGVRDWRCYAITCLWLPTLFEFQTANLSGLLVLLAAAAWRYRDRWIVAALAAGLLVALKLYGWPVLVFLFVSRRLKAAAAATAVAAAAILVPWAALGFIGLRGYPHLLDVLARVEQPEGFSVATLVAPFSTWSAARVVAYAVGAGILGASLFVRGDRRKFVVCLAATLALTPILWMHYLVVLGVFLALAYPRFSLPWLVPLLLWLVPRPPQVPHGSPQNVVPFSHGLLVAAVVAALVTVAYRPRMPKSAPQQPVPLTPES
jgi:hypothetical protein